MNLNSVKKLIIVMVLLIIITIVGILIYKSFNGEDVVEQENIEEFDSGLEYEKNDNGFEIIDDPNITFSVVNTINTYLEILKFETENQQYVGHYEVENEEQLKERVIDLLDENYINKNNINTENFYNYIDLMNYGYNVIPAEIRVRYDEYITNYIVSVYIENLQTNEISKQFYIIRVDSNNSTFSVEPVTEGVDNIDDISVDVVNNQIQNHIYNRFNITTTSTEDLIREYMNNFIRLMINYPEIAYENYINTEYRDLRFVNLEEFEKYVSSNKEEINEITPTRYLLEYEDKCKKYVVMDQYDNMYEFYETSTLSYTVRLDTYTIISDKFKETYDSSDNQYKVAMNIDKWVQMLNNRDYKAAYSLLDETFRNNNWASEEEFEQYMKENFPLHYNVEYTTFREENSTYIQEIIFSDITGESDETKTINIIMQLKDNYEFVMSFSIE